MEYFLRMNGPQGIFHSDSWPKNLQEIAERAKVVLDEDAKSKIMKPLVFLELVWNLTASHSEQDLHKLKQHLTTHIQSNDTNTQAQATTHSQPN
jgi:hypothetical protein